MPETKRVPINGPPYKNVDEIAIVNQGVTLVDGYIDEAGNTNKRPGLRSFINLGLNFPVDGLYWWDIEQCVIAICAGKIFKIINSAGVYTDITGDRLKYNIRPTFAKTTYGGKNWLVMANGTKMLLYDNENPTVYVSDPDAPTEVSHVAFIEQRIIANRVGTDEYYWNDAGEDYNPDKWVATDFQTTKNKPDNIVALHAEAGEVAAFGSESVEFFYPDGTTFTPLRGAYAARGCIAPYTAKFFNNTWYWLDYNKRLVRLEGRTPVVLSTPFDKVIQKFTKVSDAMADVMEVDGKTFYVLHFPSENKTLIYDYEKNVWMGEWGYWNTENATHERFLGNCYCHAHGWGMYLVGDRRTGIIYTMSSDYPNDNGDMIRILRRTGNYNYGSYTRKRSNEVTVKVKKGFAHKAAGLYINMDGDDVKDINLDGNIYKNINLSSYEKVTPEIMIRWRNDNGAWSREHYISLDDIGKTEFLVTLKQLGIYSSRQFEISYTGNSEFIIVDAEELIKWMTR